MMTNYATQSQSLVHNFKFSALYLGSWNTPLGNSKVLRKKFIVNNSVCFGVHIPISITSGGFFHWLYRICTSNRDIPQHCCPGECKMRVQNFPSRHHSHQLLLNPNLKVELYNGFSLIWHDNSSLTLTEEWVTALHAIFPWVTTVSEPHGVAQFMSTTKLSLTTTTEMNIYK